MNTPQEIINKLQTLVETGDEVDRCYAIRGLATLKNTASSDLLIGRLRDDDIDVCVDAASALGKLGGKASTEKLLESFLNDPDGEVKVACIEALVNLGDEKIIPHLLKTVVDRPDEMAFTTEGDWDSWWDMQLFSIRGLGKMQIEEAVPVLKKLIEEDDYHDIESEIFNALANIGGSADELLLTQLVEGKPRIRRRVAKSLGNSSTSATLKILARALQDKDPDVREATVKSLLQRDAVQYLPAILLLFRDSNAYVRQTAVKTALLLSEKAEKKDADALINKLVPLLHDDDPTVKTAVLTTLKNLKWQPDAENEETILSLLRECKGDTFTALCRFIEAANLDKAIATLVFMFRHDELGDEEKIHALMTLGYFKQWNSVIEDTLGASVFDENKAVRVAALEALAEIAKNTDKPEKDARQAIDMILEALQGNLDAPVVAGQTVIPIVPVDDANQKLDSVEEKIAKDASDDGSIVKEAEENPEECTKMLDSALAQISKSIEAGEKPIGMTTLDAMAISQVEDQLEAKKQEPEEEKPVLSPEEEKEMQAFKELSEENSKTANWLFSGRNKVAVEVDIQHLSAKILGLANTKAAIPALLEALESEDSELKRQAILSLGVLFEDNQTFEAREELCEKLVETLTDEDRDLRIAAARALAHIGSGAEAESLLLNLQDEEMAVRSHTLHALSQIAQRSDGQDINLLNIAEQMLEQLNNNATGVHRAVVDALVPLLNEKLNGDSASLKQTAIRRLINAGLAGTHGQVVDMTWGLNALDKNLSTTRLLEKMDDVTNSIERRYVVEMLSELHRPA